MKEIKSEFVLRKSYKLNSTDVENILKYGHKWISEKVSSELILISEIHIVDVNLIRKLVTVEFLNY